MLPFTLIIAGIFIYWRNFGWNITTELSWGLFWSAVCLLAGLVIWLKTLSHRHF